MLHVDSTSAHLAVLVQHDRPFRWFVQISRNDRDYQTHLTVGVSVSIVSCLQQVCHPLQFGERLVKRVAPKNVHTFVWYGNETSSVCTKHREPFRDTPCKIPIRVCRVIAGRIAGVWSVRSDA